MTSTGRHLDETQAGIPNAPSERADLYGQSYCERHQGQQPKGRTQRPDIWAHRSRMGSAKKESILDRGVVPHMGIPLPYTWLNPSTRPKTISDLQKTGKDLRSYYFKAGSISVRSVSGSKRFCIATGSTVTITSNVGDTYASRTWPARVVPSDVPTTMCVWTTGFP